MKSKHETVEECQLCTIREWFINVGNKYNYIFLFRICGPTETLNTTHCNTYRKKIMHACIIIINE